MRRFILLGLPVLALACGDDKRRGYDESEIVFGITQRVDAATGAVKTEAAYEFLSLANKGGWSTKFLRDNRGDTSGSCWLERFDARLGQPHVEAGLARFSGGALGGEGLAVLANQAEPVTREGAGWSTNDLLFFEADGFAMPTVPTQRMSAPASELAIDAPPAEGELTLRPNEDVTVTWRAATELRPSRVMVALETEEPEGRGGEVRCFFDAEAGAGVIGHDFVAQLLDGAASETPGGPKKGKLEIATHRQLTLRARGGWLIYVVATAVHREQAFVSAPLNP